MPMPQIGVCVDCRQNKYIIDGKCQRCTTADRMLDRLAEPGNLTKHRDLQELDEYLETWY